jgi:hypothetical protein
VNKHAFDLIRRHPQERKLGHLVFSKIRGVRGFHRIRGSFGDEVAQEKQFVGVERIRRMTVQVTVVDCQQFL